MFNLLPKTEKDAIRREYRLRLAIVALWLTTATLAVAALLLLPSWFLSSAKETAAVTRAAALQKSVAEQEARGLDETLRAAQGQLELLARAPPKIYLHELIIKIVSAASPKISLGSIAISGKREGKRVAQISGLARDRSALVAFSHALQNTRLFETVDLPLSNLAKEKDIAFSIAAAGGF